RSHSELSHQRPPAKPDLWTTGSTNQHRPALQCPRRFEFRGATESDRKSCTWSALVSHFGSQSLDPTPRVVTKVFAVPGSEDAYDFPYGTVPRPFNHSIETGSLCLFGAGWVIPESVFEVTRVHACRLLGLRPH